MILLFLAIVLMGFLIVFYTWPVGVEASTMEWFHYTWRIFFSFGVAFLAIVIAWLFIMPVCMNFAFQGAIRSIYRELSVPVSEEGLLTANISSFYTFYKTLGWRVLWPLLTFVSLFIFPLVTPLIAQLGIAHLSMLDGSDLSMSLLGLSGKRRIEILKAHQRELFVGGMVAGVFSFILLPTFLLWIFFIPGIFIGAGLLVLGWDIKTESD